MKKILIPIAPGFEEIEALTIVDILRRAGAEVTMAGTVSGPIQGRNAISVITDTAMDKIKTLEFDMIVLPGGAKGTENLKKNETVKGVVLRHFRNNKIIAAICAAPTILAILGITKGKTITSHPSVRGELKGEKTSDERVVTDGQIITSQSPGTAMEFAFKLVEILFGKEKVKEVNRGIIAKI